MAGSSKIITDIPDVLDFKESWLTDYWANELGVSVGRLKQAAAVVGLRVKKIRTFLEDGYRIVLEDANGVMRLIGRMTWLDDGFSIQVPYHPAKEGWLTKQPIDYRQTEGVVPIAEQFIVSDTVKLSLHMSGFAHFSSAGKKIISGYCEVIKKPKGLGFKAPEPIEVTTGPLCGFVVQGLDQFDVLEKKPAEVFHRSDLWFHPEFPNDDGAYHIEIVMLSRRSAAGAETDGVKRTVSKQLPFKSAFRFPHTLRVLELPGLWFALGLIVSPVTPDSTITSGYKISSPGFGEPGKQMFAMTAWYPRPPLLDPSEVQSLDYIAPAKRDEGNEVTLE